jgi:hypothetical protein
MHTCLLQTCKAGPINHTTAGITVGYDAEAEYSLGHQRESAAGSLAGCRVTFATAAAVATSASKIPDRCGSSALACTLANSSIFLFLLLLLLLLNPAAAHLNHDKKLHHPAAADDGAYSNAAAAAHLLEG